jgi:hypothetical protein
MEGDCSSVADRQGRGLRGVDDLAVAELVFELVAADDLK